MGEAPILMVSSYPPRLCGIATFCEEAREFIKQANPARDVLVASHEDGRGDGVFPIIKLDRRDWWRPVAALAADLKPHAIHIEHEYALYEYVDERGKGDGNAGFLHLLDSLSRWPVVVEPHTVHGRVSDTEADFLYQVCQRADIVLLKCHYQKWRLEWTFPQRGWQTPSNLMVVPHGARPDRAYSSEELRALRHELGLNGRNGRESRLAGLIGWIQSNKRWDILASMWEELAHEIRSRTGEQWVLLAAGAMRDPNHREDYERWKQELRKLQGKGLAHYYEFIPRGDLYYRMMALCDFLVLTSVDETQSGTLARIISLNKPFIATAPMEGLTAQAVESEGGLLFTSKVDLRERVIRLACDEALRVKLGENLRRYLDNVVSWETVARQYNRAYEIAIEAKRSGSQAALPPEF